MIAVGFAIFTICFLWCFVWSRANPIGFCIDQKLSLFLVWGIAVGGVLMILGVAMWIWKHT